VYSLLLSGTEESFVKGLNHALSRVRTQVRGSLRGSFGDALVMIRVLFLAGPLVIRIVKPLRSLAIEGLRPVAFAVSSSGAVVLRNVTW